VIRSAQRLVMPVTFGNAIVSFDGSIASRYYSHEVILLPAALPPVSPGELLLQEFMLPSGITRYRLAKEIGVSATRIGEIISGRRSITADTDARLCRFFGLSDGYWLRAQAACDAGVARKQLAGELNAIRVASDGRKLQPVPYAGGVRLVAVRPARELRGMLRGMDTTFVRDEEDRV
jgi:addiction module HigA family antidote